MQNNNIYLLHKLYDEQLATIRDINFTRREIDVIACIFSGRSAKKVASILALAPKTVETHTRNVMRKLECYSRENIIDFIEQSGKSLVVRAFYSGLLAQKALEDFLKNISCQAENTPSACLIIYCREHKEHIYLVDQLKEHLTLVGMRVLVKEQEASQLIFSVMNESQQLSTNHTICILSEPQMRELQSSNAAMIPSLESITFVLANNRPSESIFQNVEKNLCTVNSLGEYYHCLFSILSSLLKGDNFEKQFLDFQTQFEAPQEVWETSAAKSTSANTEQNPIRIIGFSRFSALFEKKKCWMLYACTLGILLTCLTLIKGYQSLSDEGPQQKQLIKSGLVIPTETTLLNRPELIDKIGESLKGTSGIQTVALVGIGGAGKTTLARQYAHEHQASVVWELNAETIGSLKGSFEKLAAHLAITKEDKDALKTIQNTSNPAEKEEQLIEYVKDHLHSFPSWLLIYDNVEKIADIHKYFPEDAHTWGKGKVILTTRDDNVQNNKLVNHIIPVGELGPDQRLVLFHKIMNNGNTRPFTSVDTKKIKEFLAYLPPFPLDISVAAYYLKATRISYTKYLEHLNENNKDFSNVQEDLLIGAGNYKETRYRIITLTLKKLMAHHKDFGDLLLLISLIDSQNIPRDLLNEYKSESIVESFIYHLKKHSLITNESPAFDKEPAFSIHRSTQEMSLRYLRQALDLDNDKKRIDSLAVILGKYISKIINKEDSLKMKFIIGHYKAFLAHDNLLSEISKGLIGGQLGCIYFYFDLAKATRNLEKSLSILNKYKNPDQQARFLLYLGMAYRTLAHYDKAKDMLEQSYSIYSSQPAKYSLEVAQTLGHLGQLYDECGEHKKAKDLLEKSLIMCQEHFSENPIGVARMSRYLGLAYRRSGDYTQAEKLFKKSFNIYKEYLSENDAGIFWALLNLGNIYRIRGEYDKAKKTLEKCCKVSKEIFSRNHNVFTWALFFLGRTYADLGEYKKAKNLYEQVLATHRKLYTDNNIKTSWFSAVLGDVNAQLGDLAQAKKTLEECLRVHKKYFREDHFETAWILLSLGNVYKQLGDYEQAKQTLQESLAICEKHYGQNHLETAPVLESLGQVYLLTEDRETAETLMKKSLKIFQQYKHPKIYTALESLSDLSLAQSRAINTKLSESFKKQALEYLTQALAIVTASFPPDSPHITRIQSKLNKLEQK